MTEQLLTEKYRPKTFDQIVGNRDIIDQLRNFAMRPKGEVPNILMTGPVGCGKTTAARCYIRERDLWKQQNSDPHRYEVGSFEGYNASNDRGIEFVRKITRYTKIVSESITYLNEADSMTNEAQAGMRGPLENKGNAIFILDGNDEKCFTDAIKSRCVHFRFKLLANTDIYNRLTYIIKSEGIKINQQIEKAIKELAEQSNGDMRKALNALDAFIHD
jgi:replication factor C small subunit